MPLYQIELDDGRKLHIDADDQNSPLTGAQHFLLNNPPPAKATMRTLALGNNVP